MRLNKQRFLHFFCAVVCVLQVQFSFGQDKFVLNGNIKDQATGEAMIRAVIRIEELPSLGVLSNEYGFYAIALPKGKLCLLDELDLNCTNPPHHVVDKREMYAKIALLMFYPFRQLNDLKYNGSYWRLFHNELKKHINKENTVFWKKGFEILQNIQDRSTLEKHVKRARDPISITTKNEKPNDANGTPGLHMACKRTNAEYIIKAFGQAIQNTDLSAASKTKLLAAKNSYGIPAIHWAWKSENKAAISAYAEIILSSELPAKNIRELLAANTPLLGRIAHALTNQLNLND